MMEGFEQRIRARIEELKAIREQAVAQVNAAAGAIGELEALLVPQAPEPGVGAPPA
jgi:hypothetical protein